MLTVAFLELAAVIRRKPIYAASTKLLLAVAVAGAVIAAPLGWLNAGMPAADDSLTLTAHRWLGTAMPVLLAGLWALKRPSEAAAVRLSPRGYELALAMTVVLILVQAYLGAETKHRVGAQHVLNAEYFKRIDALNYTMMHDDGQHPEGLEEADVVLVGVSRTSKTPTSIYLANRGIRTANVPLVPGIPLPHQLETLKKPLVVSLHATPERLIQVRQNRLLSLGATPSNEDYIDRQAVTDEVAHARRLSAKFDWVQLDVTRRSIEETAAAIMKLYADRQKTRPV